MSTGPLSGAGSARSSSGRCSAATAGTGCRRRSEGWVRDEPGWELAAPRPFSVVCFRHEGSDDDNAALLEHVNARGEVFLSHTKLDGRYVLRLAVGNLRTTEEDVRRAWDVLREEAT